MKTMAMSFVLIACWKGIGEMYSVKDVFKERASNPKVEAFIVKMMSIWEKIGEGKVNINTIVESLEMETGIQYDLKSGVIRNLKRKE